MAKRQETAADFTQFVLDVESRPIYKRPLAFGIGIAHCDSQDNLLDVHFPLVNYQGSYGSAAAISFMCSHDHGTGTYVLTAKILENILDCFAWCMDEKDKHPNVKLLDTLSRMSSQHGRIKIVASFIGEGDDDQGPQGVGDIYLRLHMLSRRLVLPNTIKASPGAIMPLLPNVAWTSWGPYSPAEADLKLLQARLRGKPLRVYGVDKLPHMLDYVIPSGVRIADSARVRLGAYVGDGTTVMPSGFINFNAGTRGKAMIEGRVSQGVIVGDGSDLGGASSTQGTMSGGSKIIVSIGERTLIGALAGVGIPLGDDCIVAAGVYVMPTSDIYLSDEVGYRTVKAHELAGRSGLLFKRGANGHIEARPNSKAVALNELLHKN